MARKWGGHVSIFIFQGALHFQSPFVFLLWPPIICLGFYLGSLALSGRFAHRSLRSKNIKHKRMKMSGPKAEEFIISGGRK